MSGSIMPVFGMVVIMAVIVMLFTFGMVIVMAMTMRVVFLILMGRIGRTMCRLIVVAMPLFMFMRISAAAYQKGKHAQC